MGEGLLRLSRGGRALAASQHGTRISCPSEDGSTDQVLDCRVLPPCRVICALAILHSSRKRMLVVLTIIARFCNPEVLSPLTMTQPTYHLRGRQLTGEKAMRSVLAIFLLIALCASANGAPRTLHSQSRHVMVHPGHAAIPDQVTPNGARIYRDDSVPGGLRTDHDNPPAYDDPSKFGGG